MATLVAKRTGKYVAGVKTRAANSMAKTRLRAKALGNTRGNKRANLHCRQKQWQRVWQIRSQTQRIQSLNDKSALRHSVSTVSTPNPLTGTAFPTTTPLHYNYNYAYNNNYNYCATPHYIQEL